MIQAVFDLFIKIGLWLVIGYLILLINIKIDSGDTGQMIQKHEKIVALMVVLWPWMIVSMAVTLLGKNQELVDLLYKIRDKIIKVI